MSEKPNILLIVVDQWRQDCLGSAGHPVIQTPHLDILASEGVSFSRAYAAVATCIAARASLYTGFHQRHHGRVGYRDGVPWDYPVTLGSVFSEAGYHTQAIGKMHVYPERNLLGFHNVILHDGYLHFNRRRGPNLIADDDYLHDLRQRHGPAADYIDSGVSCNGYAVNPWPYDIMLHPTAWVTTQAVDFLRRRDPSKPFFLMVSYHRPHPPFDPPQAYLDIYRDLPLPPLVKGNWNGKEGLPNVKKRRFMFDSPSVLSPDQIDRARRAYYAQCTFIDHQINRLIMSMFEHHVLQNTAVVFVSDHGEMLYDHNIVAKSMPYQFSAGVPLIICPPVGMDVQSGSVVDQPVELRDILPTLCDLADIPIPPEVDGKSLLPFLRGEAVSDWREWLHGEHEGGLLSNHWLTDGKIKYTWFSQSGVEQLFNLECDPQECCDISEEQPELLALWRTRLVQELESREEGYVRNGQLMVGQPARPILQEAGLPEPSQLPY